ncbi:hypothetical protein RHGRI_007350 [Rhododendron griersonianum]|uniref:Uncharacterized protein n=1 Tax=Rhododendron griersonianum TaxID=479676 RepID=A0AAV6KWL3_9ERIC|nr:hypothetical protein RHGRI_007350 [Rhododendron griersonianum]
MIRSCYFLFKVLDASWYMPDGQKNPLQEYKPMVFRIKMAWLFMMDREFSAHSSLVVNFLGAKWSQLMPLKQKFLSFFSDRAKMDDSDYIHIALVLMYGYAMRYAPSTVIEVRIDALVALALSACTTLVSVEPKLTIEIRNHAMKATLGFFALPNDPCDVVNPLVENLINLLSAILLTSFVEYKFKYFDG